MVFGSASSITISPKHSRDWIGTMPFEASTGGTEQCREPTVEDLRRELAEARRREAATAEVLRVISTSATNAHTVFAPIVRSAATLCNGLFSGLFQFDGKLVHLVAQKRRTTSFSFVMATSIALRLATDTRLSWKNT